MIQGLDLTIAGKVVEQFVPNINQYVSFKMLSQMSQDDMKTLGSSLGMGEMVDNFESMIYTPSAVNSISSGNANALTPVTLANSMSNNTPSPLNIPVTTQATNFLRVLERLLPFLLLILAFLLDNLFLVQVFLLIHMFRKSLPLH